MDEELDRRQQILEAAFAEFANKGFKGATIKSIAQAAGLQSPSLIYWYFPTKEDLLQAVFLSRVPLMQIATDPGPLLERPPEEVLPILAQSYLGITEQPDIPPMARLVFSEIVSRPEMAEFVADRIILGILTFLKTYLSHQVALGRLRPHDTRASARAFIGMFIPQALSHLLFPALRSDGLSNEEHIATAVDIFLTGLRV
jgi:TetR/AcrR family transcriptional regulator